MHRLVVALVTLIGLTGAVVVGAYLLLFSAGTDRAARLAPPETAFYVNVYLQPSAGQQMNLSNLIGRLPGFADDATLDDKVDQVVHNLLAGTGIDYRSDLKPWLGNQLALAVWPSPGTDVADAEPVLIAEVKDRQAAETSVARLVADGATFSVEVYEGIELRTSSEAAYAFVEEMLVAGPDAAAVRRVIDVSRGGDALADRDDFRRTMREMPADHLAAAFLDLAAIGDQAEVGAAFSGVSTAGAVLVAEAEGLRLSGSAPFDAENAAPAARAGFAMSREPSSLVEWMPRTTVAEIVIFGLRQTLEDAEAAAAATPEGQELASALDTFRAIAAFGLGIDLDADILPLFDREVAIALMGFDGDLPSGLLFMRPDDPTAAADALARVAQRLTAIGAMVRQEELDGATATVVTIPETGEVAYLVTDGGIVIFGFDTADLAAAIEAHDRGASLATSEAYRRTFEIAGSRAGNEAWVDVRALVEALDADAELDADTRDILGQIGTFGFTAPSRDEQIEFHAVLTVEETRPD
jgi:hypothetical protein